MAIPLRTDFDANTVRAAARKSKDGAQARRLLALAAIYEGSSRTEAARIGGVTLQIVRDWVVKFMGICVLITESWMMTITTSEKRKEMVSHGVV